MTIRSSCEVSTEVGGRGTELYLNYDSDLDMYLFNSDDDQGLGYIYNSNNMLVIDDNCVSSRVSILERDSDDIILLDTLELPQ